MQIWFLYMIRCGNNSLYTGITTDVRRRLIEHEQGRGAKSLRGKGPLKLEFFARAGARGRALRLEYMIKRLSKTEKELVIKTARLPALPRENRTKGKRVAAASRHDDA